MLFGIAIGNRKEIIKIAHGNDIRKSLNIVSLQVSNFAKKFSNIGNFMNLFTNTKTKK